MGSKETTHQLGWAGRRFSSAFARQRLLIVLMALTGFASGVATGPSEPARGSAHPAAFIAGGAENERLRREQAASVQRVKTLRAQLDEAARPGVVDVSDVPASIDEARLGALQAELLRVRAERVEREARHSGAAPNPAESERALHHENLLQMTYEVQLAKLSPAQRRAAHVEFLRQELETAQRVQAISAARAKDAESLPAVPQRVAAPSRWSLSSHRWKRGLSGTLLGCIFAVALAFYKERQRSLETPSVEPSARVLEGMRHGAIPLVADVLAGRQTLVGDPHHGFPASADVSQGTRGFRSSTTLLEACRDAASSVLLADWGVGRRSYALTSPEAGDGRTTVLANMGIALSQSQMRIVLVDGNLRRPHLHEVFGVADDLGLRNMLRGEIDLESADIDEITRRTSYSHVAIVPAGSGTGDPAELLQSLQLPMLMKRLTDAFDLVLVDTPSALALPDAHLLAKQCDGTILLLRAGKTAQPDAVALRDQLTKDKLFVAGVVLNGFDGSPDRTGYGEVQRVRMEAAKVA